MKKIFLSILAGLVLFGCQKEDLSFDDQNQSEQTETYLRGPKSIKADIILLPSGDATGVTDANSIETALNTLNPGETILLGVGTFYINRTIVASEGFNGTLRGVAMDDTEIIGVGSNASPFGNALINQPGWTGFS